MARAFFKLDTKEFNRTLAQYRKYSRRDAALIVNTKAFYIARRAAVETPKADRNAIVSELRGGRLKAIVMKSGRVKNVHYNLAQLIVIARRSAAGLPTSKSAIADNVKKLINARARSIAFIKAGWLPAIKRLEPLAAKIGSGAARLNRSNTGIQYGQAKGSAQPAREGSMVAFATITNDALPRKHGNLLTRIIHVLHNPDRGQVMAVALPALQRAVDFEANSMAEFIERKLRESAKEAGIKTN